GAHGLQVSRDTKSLYVSNRLEASISVINFASRSVTAKWTIAGGGSPDMLQLSPDGSQLWASGRYHATVYVFDTTSGDVLAKIPVSVLMCANVRPQGGGCLRPYLRGPSWRDARHQTPARGLREVRSAQRLACRRPLLRRRHQRLLTKTSARVQADA